MNILQQIKIYTIEYFQELAQIIWHNRTRLLSVFLIFIILLPAFSPAPKDKNSVQATDQVASNRPNFALPSFNAQDLKIPAINIQMPQGDYAQNLQPKNSPFDSGTLDQRLDMVLTDVEKVKDSLKIAKKVRYEGKVSWAENLKSNLYTDKFNPGSSVKITQNNKSYIKNVDEKSIMTDDNLLLVSRDVFTEIGGDPKSQKSINVIVEQ
jgi:hypothetical protein